MTMQRVDGRLRACIGLPLVLLALFGTTLLGQRSVSSSADCASDGDLGGVTNQGGYSFLYASAFSDALACVAWTVTNTPGRPDTPVRWADFGDKAVLDTTLAGCASIQECQLRTQNSIFPVSKPQPLESGLGWGMNGDEFQQQPQPQAFQEPPRRAATPAILNDLRSRLLGTFVIQGFEGPERLLPLDVTVTASYALREGRNVFTYRILLDQGPDGVRLVTSRDELTEGFALLWGSASLANQEFVEQLRSQTDTALLSLGDPMTVQMSSLGEPQLVSDELLEVYFGNTRVVGSRAPAYQPQ